MRAAGCVINDYADRHVDGSVERTNTRPLPNGEIQPQHVLALFGFIVTGLIFVVQTNLLTIYLSLGGLLLATIGPFLKRELHICRKWD